MFPPGCSSTKENLLLAGSIVAKPKGEPSQTKPPALAALLNAIASPATAEASSPLSMMAGEMSVTGKAVAEGISGEAVGVEVAAAAVGEI